MSGLTHRKHIRLENYSILNAHNIIRIPQSKDSVYVDMFWKKQTQKSVRRISIPWNVLWNNYWSPDVRNRHLIGMP